jgi:hypothetical protein
LKASLRAIDSASFSTQLTRLVAKRRETDFGSIIRTVCRQIAVEKGYFALHADDKSYLLYDIQFFLYSAARGVKTQEQYLTAYPQMIAFGDGELTTGGYGPGFIEEWFENRRTSRDIIARGGRLTFSKRFLKAFQERLSEFR